MAECKRMGQHIRFEHFSRELNRSGSDKSGMKDQEKEKDISDAILYFFIFLLYFFRFIYFLHRMNRQKRIQQSKRNAP